MKRAEGQADRKWSEIIASDKTAEMFMLNTCTSDFVQCCFFLRQRICLQKGCLCRIPDNRYKCE